VKPRTTPNPLDLPQKAWFHPRKIARQGRQSSFFGSAQCILSHSRRRMNRVAHCTCISQLFQKERVCRIGLGVRLSFLPPAETELQRYTKGLAKHELPTHEKDPLSAEIIAGPMSHSQTGLAEAHNLLSRVHGLALERSIRSLVGSTRYAVPVHQNQRRRASVPPTRRSGSQFCGFSEGGWVFSRNPFPSCV